MTRGGRLAGILVGVSLLAVALRPFLPHAAVDLARSPGDERTGRAREFWTQFREGSARRQAGDFAGALASYEAALAIRPDHEDSLYYLGNCYRERGAYADALKAYRRLVAVNPEGSSRGYMQIGLIYASLEADAPRDLNQAEQMFDRALALDPDSGALLGLAEVALLRGEWGAARSRLKALDAENPMSMAAPYLLGYLAFRRSAKGEAYRLFCTAVDRGVVQKPAVKWTEEGDLKADPALRWRALSLQSVTGAYWLRLRAYTGTGARRIEDMEVEYRRLHAAISSGRP